MQLVTRCPSCSTLFKVVPDQLKISEGWVRCGQCSHVFEASTHFVSEPTESKAIENTTKNATKNIAKNDHMTLTSGKFSEKSAVSRSVDVPKTGIDPTPVSTPVSISVSKPSFESASTPSSSASAPLAAATLPMPALAIAPVSAAALPGAAAPVSTAAPDLPDQPTPDFVRQAQSAARWRSPWVLAMLAVLALLALLVLAAQIALQERARLAAIEPQTKPWLEKLCQIERYTQGAACTVGALQQIESIVVDASTFNKLRFDASSETYRLAASLKNTSALPLAMPAVEVSFTDSQEKVLLRRVLSAADFGANPTQAQSLAAGAEFAGSSTLQVNLASLGGGKITGYRLLAFYP